MFQTAECNKETSKESGLGVRESDDTKMPDRLKPIYMKTA